MIKPDTNQESLPDVADADWLQGEGPQKIFKAVQARGGEARIVGGTVRNHLMGEAVSDVDFATNLIPEEVVAAAAAAGLRAVPTGIEHGTVTLVHNHQGYEITTLRKDVETFGRKARVTFTKNWEQDASRRDFTMNALYCDACGRLYDPVGGYADLMAGKVRFIGNAAERIREDYLRTLRFFRFFAHYAKSDIDEDGLEACARERKGLRKLSAERIFHELVRLLAAPRADEAARLMSEKEIFTGADLGRARPEILGRLVSIERGLSLDPDPILRLWALLGGGSSPDSRAESLAGRLRVSSQVRSRIQIMSAERDISPALKQTERRAALYALGRDVYREQVMLNWAASDAGADDMDWTVLFNLSDQWQLPDFPIKGADVVAAGVPAGPQVGKVLRVLELWWIGSGFPEDREQIDAQIKTLMEDL